MVSCRIPHIKKSERCGSPHAGSSTCCGCDSGCWIEDVVSDESGYKQAVKIVSDHDSVIIKRTETRIWSEAIEHIKSIYPGTGMHGFLIEEGKRKGYLK